MNANVVFGDSRSCPNVTFQRMWRMRRTNGIGFTLAGMLCILVEDTLVI